MSLAAVPAPIREFLAAATPDAWLQRAPAELDTLLLDHANCEMKAASTAISMIYRYPDAGKLVYRMSRLAREELRHFEQVQRHIDERGIIRQKLGPSRYASGLQHAVSEAEPARLRQRLIVGALIEARSCERFALLAGRLPAEIATLYRGLLESEARHFEHYLALARSVNDGGEEAFNCDVARLRDIEADLIVSPDPAFRFHSGCPRDP